jgi:hypothetical protein
MGPGHRHAAVRRDAQHHADQPFRSEDWIEGSNPLSGAGAEQQSSSISGMGLVQHLGWSVAGSETVTQLEQLPEALVLRPQRGKKLGHIGGGIALGNDGAKPHPAGATFLGPGLQPHEWSEHRVAERIGYGVAPACRREQGDNGKAETQDEQHCVPASVAAVRNAGHAQADSTLRYFS